MGRERGTGKERLCLHLGVANVRKVFVGESIDSTYRSGLDGLLSFVLLFFFALSGAFCS